MARVEKGNGLSEIELQPGWTIEDDGFGLLTCSAVYKCDHGTSTGTPGRGEQALGKAPARNAEFPQDKRLICHRSSSSMDANGIQTISADYVGIAFGDRTKPQVTGRFSSNQEPIATHPMFAKQIGGTPDAPQNGAEFNEDGSFKRFADIGFDEFYGVTSYLNCGFAISGHFYTSNFSTVNAMKDAIGTTSYSGGFGGVNVLGDLSQLQPTWQTPRENDQLLLTGMGLEFYGKLVKISFDVMFSQDGWVSAIYGRRAASGGTKSNSGKWDGKGTLGLGAAFNSRGAAGSNFGT